MIRNKRKKIAIIGSGPQAKKSYMNTLIANGLIPELIVDLKSQEESIREYLNQNNLDIEVLLIPDKFRDYEYLNDEVKEKLKEKLDELEINYVLIVTEPKAHFAYLQFLLEYGKANILVDKPITVPTRIYNPETREYKPEEIEKIKTQFLELMELYEQKKDKIHVAVMTQREVNHAYQYIFNVVKGMIKKYQVPVTDISIFHSDGKWNPPHEYDIENHPYRYGYGKLFHSGYHFVDLLVKILRLNKYLEDDNKKITDVKIASFKYNLQDELTVITESDLMKLFVNQKFPEFYDSEIDEEDYEHYGEKNLYSLMQFKNAKGRAITTASLTLLQSSFSRRAWINSKADIHKGNGRVRHESVKIRLGYLMSINVDSYQAKEESEKLDFESEHEIGGIYHFEITIFNNMGIIGGKNSIKQININDLYKNIDRENFRGYNEKAREELLLKFINDELEVSDLSEHDLGVELLYNIAKIIYGEEGEGITSSHIEDLF